MIKYRFKLLATERLELLAKVQKGKASAKTIQKAQVLLASDDALERQSETVVAATYHLSTRSVERIRKDFCERGMAMFQAKPRQPRSDKKLTGELEAHLIAIACSEPPAGETRWKLQAIADRLVELQVVEHLSHTSVATVLKKNELKPWRVKGWVIPPKQNADFVYHMEQVLAVYERPYNAFFPVVCLDESPKQLLEVVQYRAADGTRIEDSEYFRHGVGEIYMAFEPLAGQRFATVKDDHKAITWVAVIAALLDGPYENCVKMTLVGDNLSAHKPSAFYAVFDAEKAKAYLDRLEFVYTPRHGSWLDMAEIELSILQRDCLNRPIATKDELVAQIKAWQDKRNQRQAKANWQFTNKDARIKLHKLYPTT